MSGDTIGEGMRVRTSTVHSAGGVVLREGPGGLESLLIATHGGRRWSLPKGRLEDDESSGEAAIREVEEETGITATILAPLETVEYWFYASRTLRLHKFVEYFLMAFESGEPRPQITEVDEVRWWPIAEAMERVTYKNDRRLLEMARDAWGEAGR